jgi:hypothetical protein
MREMAMCKDVRRRGWDKAREVEKGVMCIGRVEGWDLLLYLRTRNYFPHLSFISSLHSAQEGRFQFSDLVSVLPCTVLQSH